MRGYAAIAAGLALAGLTAIVPAQGQGGTNHGYCYATIFAAGHVQKLWISNPYPVGNPDTAQDDFAAIVVKLGAKKTQVHCDSGYNGAAVAAQAKQKRIGEAKDEGAEVVPVNWPG